jgi:hypothetical protein
MTSARRGIDAAAPGDVELSGSVRGVSLCAAVDVATVGRAVRIAADAALNVEGSAVPAGAALDETSAERAELTLAFDAAVGLSPAASSSCASLAVRAVMVSGVESEPTMVALRDVAEAMLSSTLAVRASSTSAGAPVPTSTSVMSGEAVCHEPARSSFSGAGVVAGS